MMTTERMINLGKDDLETILSGRLSAGQRQYLRQQRLLVGVELMSLAMVIGLIILLLIQQIWLILLPLGLFWLWLLKDAPQQWRQIQKDLRTGEVTLIDGVVSCDIRFTPGLIRLARYRITMNGRSFAVEKPVFSQFRNQDDYRVYYTPHAGIFLGAIPLADAPTTNPDLLGQFTQRELDILKRLAAGLSNKEIAADLHISINTVKSYVSQVYHKLNVNRRTEAVAHARKLGII